MQFVLYDFLQSELYEFTNKKPSSDEGSDNRTINLVKNKTTINIYNGTINATKTALFRIDNANAKVTIGKMPSGSETAASVRTVVDFIPNSGDPNMFNLVYIFNGFYIMKMVTLFSVTIFEHLFVSDFSYFINRFYPFLIIHMFFVLVVSYSYPGMTSR